ncbi:UNVERIFIED_CONTAM: hypothetical protein PYX00_004263 [Menopon gallinae]|uniref:G-protein coupled receptors family 1 profile domain-containing protein n=1 Tax=Menopon gallinae TaxID=328185 RepID=A0AAW2I4J7_9NEOP
MAEYTASVDEPSNGTTEWTPTQIPKQEITWSNLSLAIFFCICIVITVVGNTLVILAVITTRRLRSVTNCYVMSLAVADWLVGVFVMPPEVALHLMGSWELGAIFCEIWISLDIMCCTASILSLCAISVDRYLAVTQPLNYSRRRRSKKLALLMILVVWLAAAAITCPPIFGWYDSNQHKDKTCGYSKNMGYVIFSAMGSFFLPLIVMLYMYARISCVVAKRHDKLGQVHNDPKRYYKSGNCQDESDGADRSFYDEDRHHPVLKSTRFSSLSSNEHGQYTTTIHQQRSIRSHHSHFSCHSHHSSSTELCGNNSRMSFYGGGRPHRTENLALDASAGEHSCSMKKESSSRVSSFRRENKTTQTLTIVVGGFVACWLPFFITYIMTPFLPEWAIPNLLMTIFIWLGWLNSAINPFIYAFYSVDFRTAFWRLTFRHCQKNHKSQKQYFSRKQ